VTRSLRNALLATELPGIQRPAYDRAKVTPGIVHIGPGAFHRAHQAVYVDDLLAQDPRWGITGISLRSPDVAEALTPQAGLYTLLLTGEETRARIIGSIAGVIVTRSAQAQAIQRLAAPETGLITLTITEKGYCLDEVGALDTEHADIRHDATHPHQPRSAIGYLVAGLAARRAQGLAPPAILSCDNLPENGARLRGAVLQLASLTDPDLARWIEGEVCFPGSMVDSITPATSPALREQVRTQFGLEDSWPIQREPFTAWVIEDMPRAALPDFASVGATITSDVAAYATAKLRLLNGAHSALAYYGAALGETTVAGAMRNARVERYVTTLLRDELAPAVKAPPGLDLAEYCATILQRFGNPAIEYTLVQIGSDGSQKIPIRLLATLNDNLAAGRPIAGIAAALAGWIIFVRQFAKAGRALPDPSAAHLAALANAATGRGDEDARLFMEHSGLFAPELAAHSGLRDAIAQAYDELIKTTEKTAGRRIGQDAA
tara:strand:- start:28883 stop:30355 length:1473 start_codon:yes stop_codon:yes gene_type:complete